MGIVYKGFHDGLSRSAAIKTLDPAQNTDPEVRRRLGVEARVQARLQHPNIVTIYDLIEDQGEVFIAMEYVEGRPLDAVLKERQGKGLPLSEALSLFSQLLAALVYAHQHGVIHRDVKPANVMLSGEQVKLMDFGIALLAGAYRHTSPSAVLGTPAYMSPEQLQSLEIDARSDIYSAAVMLFEMLAGRHPFPGRKDYAVIKAHLDEVPPELKTLVPEIPPGVSDVVAIALRKDRDRRFQTAEEFLVALQEGAAGFLPVTPEAAASSSAQIPSAAEAVTPPPPPTLLLPSRQSQQRRLIAVSCILLALGLSGTYGLWRAWYRPAVPIRPPQQQQGRVAASPPPSITMTQREDTLREETPRHQAIAEEPTPPPKKKVVEPPTPPTTAPNPPVPEGPDPAEVRRQEVSQLRELVSQGVKNVETEVQAQDFDAAEKDLDGLIGQAQRYPAELEGEIEEIRGLRKRLTDLIVRQAAWEERLRQIHRLMEQNQYPEAKNLALVLSREPGVPEPVAAQAQELATQAKEELKKIWSETQMGPTKNEIRKPRKPPESLRRES